MADTSAYGMATSLFASMAAEGVQVGDGTAVQAWISPYHEAFTAPSEPVVLPAVTVADATELRPLAAPAPLVVRVGALPSSLQRSRTTCRGCWARTTS